MPRNFYLPSFPDRVALERSKQIVHYEPDEDEQANEIEPAPERSSREYPAVEQENGEFDCGY